MIEQIAQEKNISKTAAETYLNTSGLKIYSTQDVDIQKIMEDEMAEDKYTLYAKDAKGNIITDSMLFELLDY